MSENYCTNPRYLGKLTHGQCRNNKPSRAYNSWTNMRARCQNRDDKRYRDYGARGIVVCERWDGVGGFENFLADMGEPPTNMSLERIDNQGNYEPSNCRWASRKDQQRNNRRNVLVTWLGKTQCLSAWAEELGIPRTALEHRFKRGWTIERMLTLPLQKK
jgi:hypothetical protein